MRKTTIALAAVAVALFLGLGPAASAQTATSLPGVPAGQGGPDNGVNNTQQGGSAPGGQNNPATNAGPAVAEDEGSSLTPWLVGAALLVVLAAGGALMARKASASRDDTYAGRSSVA
jgi:hypothetical protein